MSLKDMQAPCIICLLAPCIEPCLYLCPTKPLPGEEIEDDVALKNEFVHAGVKKPTADAKKPSAKVAVAPNSPSAATPKATAPT